MKTVALISGGKDSCFNMMQCVAAGHQLVALANLRPAEKDELDSYMYQTVGHDAIDLYAGAVGLPLYRQYIKGGSVEQGSEYYQNDKDEVEDLYQLLSHVKEVEGIEAVAVGAILSNYQRVRVEHVCQRLKLTSLSYLWRRDQEELLDEMIECGMHAILIKVAALGLSPDKHLGKSLEALRSELIRLNEKFGLNVCGEGGEYETLTLDCPLFVKRIVVEESEVVSHSTDPFAPVAYLRFTKLRLEDKDVPDDLAERFQSLPIRTPVDFCLNELASTEEREQLLSSHPQTLVQHLQNNCARIGESATGGFLVSGLTCQSVAEFRDLMDTVKGLLEERHSSMSSVVSVGLYIRNMSDYPDLNDIYGRYFGLNPPVRVCVQVPMTSCVIMEVAAASAEKKSMHVQSVSHWSPANIGPYSQCQQVGHLFHVSGQIGLIPGSMQLPDPPNFAAECRLALRHADRTLKAMESGMSLARALQVVCYVRDSERVPQASSIWAQLTGCKAHVVYAVVDDLPRCAQVEWQITAVRSENVEHQVFDRQVEVASCNSIVSAICRIPDSLPAAELSPRLQSIVSHFSDVFAIRLFYRVDRGLKSLEMLLKAIPESLPSTLVPVRGLEHPSLLAVLCCLQCG